MVKGAQANVYENVDCTGTTCTIDNIVATLTLNFPGKTGVHTYIKTNDGIANSAAGGDVDNRTYQNNSTTMTLLKDYYDVVVKIGTETYILDEVDCTGDTCTYSLTVSNYSTLVGTGSLMACPILQQRLEDDWHHTSQRHVKLRHARCPRHILVQNVLCRLHTTEVEYQHCYNQSDHFPDPSCGSSLPGFRIPRHSPVEALNITLLDGRPSVRV